MTKIIKKPSTSQSMVVKTECDDVHNKVNHGGHLDSNVLVVQCDNHNATQVNSLPRTTIYPHLLDLDNSANNNSVNNKKWFTEKGFEVVSLNMFDRYSQTK